MDPKDSCVFYRNWIEAAQTIKNEALRCRFYEALLQYALDGMKTDVPPELEIALAFIYSLIDKDRAKYQKICERRAEAGRKGAAKTNSMRQKSANSANAENERQKSANSADNDNDNVNDNDNENDTQKSKDFMSVIPPLTPQGAKGGAGASSFEDFLGRVKAIKVPKAVEDSGYTAQYVWRMAEGNPGYGLAVSRAIQTSSASQEQFVQAMQQINARFKAQTDFMAVKLALATARCTPAAQAAVIAEAERAKGEADIWKTLLGKVEYILAGNKVGSLAGFMRARQGKG